MLVAVTTGLLTLSCKEKPKTEAKALTLASSSITTKVNLDNDTSKLSLTISVAIDYPSGYADPAILKKARRVVLMDFFPEIDSVFATPDEVLNAYIKDYKAFFFESESAYASMEDEEGMFSSDPWYNHQHMKVRYNTNFLFSYTVAIDRFSGGAHGEKKYINTVVDLRTGKKVTEDDLFTEKAKALVAGLIVDKIMKQHDLKTIEDLEEIGYFDLKELDLNNNFYLTDKGLTYTFNEYDIAGYAVGTTEVFLDFKGLSGYLRPGNPFAHILD